MQSYDELLTDDELSCARVIICCRLFLEFA